MPAVDLEMEQRTALLTTLVEFERAENNKDVPAMLAYIAEDCVFVHRDRMLAGKRAIGEMLRGLQKLPVFETRPRAHRNFFVRRHHLAAGL